MAGLPVHPRVARLLCRAAELGCHALGADLAAVLAERDIMRRSGEGAHARREPDIEVRIELLRAWRKGGGDGDPWALRAVERTSKQLMRLLGDKGANRDRLCDHDTVGRLLLCAYPDRLGMRRAEGRDRYVLSQGRGIRFPSASVLSQSPYIVAPNVDTGIRADGIVHLAASVTDQTIREELSDRIETVRRVEWDSRENCVVATSEERLGGVVLSSKPFTPTDEEAAPLLCDAIRRTPGLLTFRKEARQFQARVALVRRLFPDEEWPDLSGDALLAEPERWLVPYLGGIRSASDLSCLDVLTALTGMLSRGQARHLDERAPCHLTVPSGRRVLLDYAAGDSPVLAVKLQEMFGLADTPVIAGGRARVLIHLLSPAGRPVQVTQDLRSFWNSGYQQVRKELRGRYPKHHWPDDPWNATPTGKTKRKGG
jgi:ATP-dependent helicase HrpB